MHYQKTTSELVARAIKVCDEICDYTTNHHSYGNNLTDCVDLAKSCKEVLEVLQSVVESDSKDDQVASSAEKRIAKCEDDIRELKKQLKEYKYSNQKWPGGRLLYRFRGKELPNLKPNLQSLRDKLGRATKLTTVTVEKWEHRTVKTILHDEADDETEPPPPRYTRYENKPCTTYSTKSTSTKTLPADFAAQEARGPAPAYRSLHKTANGANLHLGEANMLYREYNTMAHPWSLGCRSQFYEAKPTGVYIAMNYRDRAPRYVFYLQDVQFCCFNTR